MDVIIVRKSSGELLTTGGGSYYGSTRTDDVPVRSSVPVRIRFLDDGNNPTLLNPATGVLTFTAQPAANDTFTVGATTYTATATLTGAANEVLLGANLADFIANLVGAVNAPDDSPTTYAATGLPAGLSVSATTGLISGTPTFTGTTNVVVGARNAGGSASSGEALVTTSGTPFTYQITLTAGQVPGITYGMGTAANAAATAAASGSTIFFAARYADASGNTVATTEACSVASFGAATLGGADVLSFDIKPQGEYDASPTLVSPVFTAPADPATDDYAGTLLTMAALAIALLDPNNVGGTTPNAVEPDSVPLMAQLSWGPVTTPATPPQRSDEWTIALRNVVRHDSDGVPTDATNGPTLAQVATAIAQAAAADTPAARDEAIAAAFAARPTPIQPPSAYEANDYKFAQAGLAGDPNSGNFVTSVLDISNQGITSIDPAYLTSAINFSRYVAGGINTINASGNAFTFDGLSAFLGTLATYASVFSFGINVDVSGGTSASPVIPALWTLDFSAVDIAAINAGSGNGVTLNYNPTGNYGISINLYPGDQLDQSSGNAIGTSDATTTDQLAAAFFAQCRVIDSTNVSQSGSVVQVSTTPSSDDAGLLPFSAGQAAYANGDTSGVAITVQQQGDASVYGYISTIQQNGGSVTTN